MNEDQGTNIIKRGRPETRDKLIKILNSVYRTSENPLEGMALEFPHLFSLENIHNTYYIEDEGIPVSQASVYEWTCFLNGVNISVVSLGSVSTLEKYRHRGLSTKIIRRIMEDKRDEGFSLMLVSGEIELYTKLNCVKAGLVYSTTFHTGSAKGLWECNVVSEEERVKHAEKYHTIYSRESYRYLRTENLTATLMNALWFKRKSHRMELFEILNVGELVAYVVVYAGISNENGSVMEYAGSRDAVVDCLPSIAQSMGWKSIRVSVNPEDYAMIHIVDKNGLAVNHVKSQGTMVVLNWNNLVDQLNPIVIERTGSPLSVKEGPGERWVITIGNRNISVNGIDGLTSLIFGDEEESLKIPLMFTNDLSYI